MNSSAKQTTDPHAAPLVREAGVPYERAHTTDPLQQWMDLMEVVEALCPRWPPRPVIEGGRFLL